MWQFSLLPPALDRARAKLDALFADPALPRDPNRYRSYNILNSPRYTFGDEKRLRIVHDINGIGGIQRQPGTTYVLENDETLDTGNLQLIRITTANLIVIPSTASTSVVPLWSKWTIQ